MNVNYRLSLFALVRWLVAIVLVVLVGRFLIDMFTSGSLQVTTGGSNATISITTAPAQGGANPGKTMTVKTGTGSLSARLGSGIYIVTARSGSSQSNETVDIGWLSSKSIQLIPSRNVATEPVLYESVQDIAVDANRMIYLSNDFNGIEYLGANNHDGQIQGNQYFTSAVWASTSYGVAQAKAGSLYVINGDSAHALQSPSPTGSAFAVAPDKTIYVGHGTSLYRGNTQQGFTKIYDGFTTGDRVEASDGQVALINPGNKNMGGSLVLVSTSGKVVQKHFGYQISDWSAWSQGGKYIVISVGGRPDLFDASLNQVATLPAAGAITRGSWLGDNSFYYASAGQLWSYNVSDLEATLLATLPGKKNIQSVTVSQDGTYAYVTASDLGSHYPRVVFRAALKGQQIPQEMSTLEDVLPINGATYSVGLRNFSGTPMFDVLAYPGTDPTSDLQAAQAAVQGMVDESKYNFYVEPGD